MKGHERVIAPRLSFEPAGEIHAVVHLGAKRTELTPRGKPPASVLHRHRIAIGHEEIGDQPAIRFVVGRLHGDGRERPRPAGKMDIGGGSTDQPRGGIEGPGAAERPNRRLRLRGPLSEIAAQARKVRSRVPPRHARHARAGRHSSGRFTKRIRFAVLDAGPNSKSSRSSNGARPRRSRRCSGTAGCGRRMRLAFGTSIPARTRANKIGAAVRTQTCNSAPVYDTA